MIWSAGAWAAIMCGSNNSISKRTRSSRGSSANEQRQLAPLPITVHIGESNRAQPFELRMDVEQLVRWIFFSRRDAHRLEEPFVRGSGHGCHVLQVAEYAARKQPRPDLAVELSFSI